MAVETRKPITPAPQTLYNELELISDSVQYHVDSVQSMYLFQGNLADDFRDTLLDEVVAYRSELKLLIESYVEGGGIYSEILEDKIQVISDRLNQLETLLRLDRPDTVTPNPPQMQVGFAALETMTFQELIDGIDTTAEAEYLRNYNTADIESLLNPDGVSDGVLAQGLTQFEQETLLRILESSRFDPELSGLGIVGEGIEASIRGLQEAAKIFGIDDIF